MSHNRKRAGTFGLYTFITSFAVLIVSISWFVRNPYHPSPFPKEDEGGTWLAISCLLVSFYLGVIAHLVAKIWLPDPAPIRPGKTITTRDVELEQVQVTELSTEAATR